LYAVSFGSRSVPRRSPAQSLRTSRPCTAHSVLRAHQDTNSSNESWAVSASPPRKPSVSTVWSMTLSSTIARTRCG
jgi:hypothetical protein